MPFGIAGGPVNGRYRLVRGLGEGGMGTVYLAADLAEEQRPVALKKVHSTLLTPEAIEALRAEFSLMTRLRHPHVVEVYDLGVDASTGDPFLTLEYIEGDDFRKACEGRPLAEQVELMAQVCRGLNYIHSRGLIHNDLKPQNILVTASSPRICKLTDFGLASIDTSDTARQGLRGTLQYLAPELIHGEKPDRRSDLYALGVVFYLVLTGRLPFDGSVPEILTATTSGDPPPLRASRPDLPPALEALVLRLLSKNPAARPESAAAVLSRLNEAAGTNHPIETAGTIALSARSTRFVGRSKEMERLIRQLEACAGAEASRPTGRLMMVSGESGIGKSRLIRQLRYEAQMRGIQVLAGVCYEGTASAFHPFVQILRQLRPAEADGAGKDFQGLVGADNPVPGADPERERRRLSDAGVQALLDAAEDRPVMICVEDLQWADTATLSLLEHLARNVARAPRLLLLISYRSEDAEAPPLSSMLPRLVRAGAWERLELTRLREEHVAEMMRGIFGKEEAPAPLVSLVARETEGNPFFVQMALEGLLEDSPTPGALEDLEQIRFPRSMTEAIARRLADLDSMERRVMESLAVIECPVAPGMLASIAMPDGSSALLGGAVDRLRRRRLVRQELDDTGCVRLRLDHVKLRDHVYEAMDWQERRDLHGVIGLALEAGGNAALEELAHHFTHSPDDGRALEYAERGGLHALSLMATERAVSYLERALELVPQKEPERRLQLQLHLGDAYRQARDHTRAMETYEKVVRGARSAGIKDMAWTATLHLLDLQQRSGLYEEAQRGAEKIVPALEAEGRKALLARCLTTLAVIAAIQGRLDEARDLNLRALALRREVDDIRGQAVNLNNLGTIDSLAGDTAAALPLLEEALALHRQAGDIQRSIETLMNIAHWHRFAGGMGLSVSRFEEAADMARRAHDRWLLSLAETALAGLYHLQGRLDAALAIARRAVSDAQSVGNEERECEALDVLGMVQRDLGDPAGALASHERAVTLARRAGHLSQEIYATVSAALDKLAGSPHEGDLRSVRDALRKAARAGAEIPSDKLKARLHEAMGRCHLASGEPAAALDSARQAVDAARASRVPASIASAELLLATCLLAPGLPERDPAEAAEAARRAARLGADAGLPEPRWRAHAQLAAIHREEGRRNAEREELLQASSVLETMAGLIEDDPARLAWMSDARRSDVMRRAAPLTSGARRAPGERGEATPERALSAMFELSGIINTMSDLDTMLARLLDVGLGIVSAERGLIILLNEAGAQEVAAARDLEEETVRDALEYSHSVVKEAASGQVVIALDTNQDDRFRKYRSVSLYAIKSLMCVPMRVRDQIIGTVYVDSRRQGIPFTEQDLRFLEAFANLAASAVEQARLHEKLATENVYLRREAAERHHYQNIIGKNVKMQAVYDLMEKVGASNLPVLIQGESGTGKELVARGLHYSSPRRHRKFYSENVAAIPDTLLESEMFGHVRGAFTGADRDRKGLFELADGGTLFLDEIGDMSLPMQAKLLRTLQDGEIRPVGGKDIRKVDVRIVSATNKDLEQMIKDKIFREDLFYRLNVVRIPLPPLRERKEDIPLLVDHFLTKAARDSGAAPKRIDMGTLQLLLRYAWPGNVRELENEILRLAVLCPGEVITQRDLMDNAELYEKITSLDDQQAFTRLEELERLQIEKALMEAGGNRARAADLLGISRATIFRKLRKYNFPQ